MHLNFRQRTTVDQRLRAPHVGKLVVSLTVVPLLHALQVCCMRLAESCKQWVSNVGGLTKHRVSFPHWGPGECQLQFVYRHQDNLLFLFPAVLRNSADFSYSLVDAIHGSDTMCEICLSVGHEAMKASMCNLPDPDVHFRIHGDKSPYLEVDSIGGTTGNVQYVVHALLLLITIQTQLSGHISNFEVSGSHVVHNSINRHWSIRGENVRGWCWQGGQSAWSLLVFVIFLPVLEPRTIRGCSRRQGIDPGVGRFC